MKKKSRWKKQRRDLRQEEDEHQVSPARYEHLDSLRGIAALAVVFSHLCDIGRYQHVTSCQWVWWYAGHQAVILFFVLSGFVLSIPFHESRQLPYQLFVSRRFIRIWMPYMVVVVAAFFWRKWSNENSVPAMPLDPIWQTPVTWHLLFSYLILIGNMNYDALVPSAWTLVHEMRISFLFPFIFLICSRRSWQYNLLLAIVTSLGANLACTLLASHRWMDDYAPFQTVHYTAMFITGIVLARYRTKLVAWKQNLTKSNTVLFYLGTFIFYFFPFYNPFSESQRMLGDLPTMFGSAGLIVLALSSGWRFFGHPLPVFWGRISYSLYLVHLPIILVLANSLFLKIPTMALYMVMLGVVLIGSMLFWYLVERPALAWSRAIGHA